MSDVSRILQQAQRGDRQAAAELLPLVYEELRRLAAAKLAHENPGQTLQATALVHEAYLRLVGHEDAERWDNRGHFFAAAAEAMRRILVEAARRKAALKRGGDADREPLGDVAIASSADGLELLALDAALERLAAVDEQAAAVVKLRYFAGLSMDQVALAVGVSPRGAYYAWEYARAWLRRDLRAAGPCAAAPLQANLGGNLS